LHWDSWYSVVLFKQSNLKTFLENVLDNFLVQIDGLLSSLDTVQIMYFFFKQNHEAEHLNYENVTLYLNDTR